MRGDPPLANPNMLPVKDGGDGAIHPARGFCHASKNGGTQADPRLAIQRIGRGVLDLFLDMDTMRAAYDEVYAYTFDRPGFILQHVVDAFAVQTASDDSKPIAVVFGLVGLYLRVEKQFSGRQVQKAHMQLGRKKREWPRIYLPDDRGRMTVADVLAASAGPARDIAIDTWCRSLWAAYSDNHQAIVALLREHHIV
jgi:hypothetical protein